METYHGNTISTNAPNEISLRCPSCGQNGTFEGAGVNDISIFDTRRSHAVFAGLRRCPNPDCLLIVFAVRDNTNTLVASYPPEVIDFDTTNLPTAVTEALSEAITCHANQCYTAAAIMIRKTLEELCADRGAEGANLKERLAALRDKVVIPEELLTGADDLRLLGNDAAHIESREYDQVGQEEVEVGLDFAKELLKAVYQMSALLARLRGLKASREAS